MTMPDGSLTYINHFDSGVSGLTHSVMKQNSNNGFTARVGTTNLRSYLHNNLGFYTLEDNSGLNYDSFQLVLDVTKNPNLVLTASGVQGVTMHSFSSLSLLNYISKVGTTFAKGIALDSNIGVAFVGEAHSIGETVESYPYNGTGFGVQIAATLADAYSANWIEIDTEWRLLHVTSGNPFAPALFSVSYDSNGDNLLKKSIANMLVRNQNFAGCGIDTSRKYVIDCNNSGLFLYEYYQNGTYSAPLSSILGKQFISARVYPRLRLIVTTALNNGIFVYQYSEDGKSLLLIDSDNKAGDYLGVGVDFENGSLMTIKSGDGFYSYLIHISPEPDVNQEQDSIEGLGSVSQKLFREPNWLQLPKNNFDFSREINQYNGTTLNIYELIEESISELTYLFTNLDKESEYYFTNFFNSRKGRHKKFWLPYWKNPFNLLNDISSGDRILTIDNCYYNRIDFGYERIFFKLKNEVIITRQVTAVIQNGLTEDIILTTPIDRDIELSEIKYFSRLLLVRFNDDTMKLNFSTDNKSQISFNFRELPFEHTEVES